MPSSTPSATMTGPQEFGAAGSPTAIYRANFDRSLINADNAIGATTLITAMAIWVNAGDILTKASICVGATAGATLTHKYFALYSYITVPAFLGSTQSADDTGASMAANTVYTQSFTAPFTVTASGLIWVAFCITGTTIPTLVGRTVSVNATAAAALNTLCGATNGLCVTATGAASVAPATMASLTQLAVQPWVLLQ